jgi:hypothetical protein
MAARLSKPSQRSQSIAKVSDVRWASECLKRQKQRYVANKKNRLRERRSRIDSDTMAGDE